MSYLMSQMMHKKNYPLEHEVTEAKFKKLKRKSDYSDLTLEEYRDFLSGGDMSRSLMHMFEIYGDDFVSRAQFLNWITERRLKDGRII